MRANRAAALSGAITYEGGKAVSYLKPIQSLRRAVSTCMLWENTFYEKGSEIVSNIETLCKEVSIEELVALAIESRECLHLRHVPLFLGLQLARLHKGSIVGDTLARVIRRPDEATEFLSLWWKEGRGSTSRLSAQVKRALRLKFAVWDEYRLAKYSCSNSAVKLRDALFLSHAKPKDEEQSQLWKRLICGELQPPDTWEVSLSAGTDKKQTWERLISEKKLGYQALLMNLRNMLAVGVDSALIRAALTDGYSEQMFPYRFLAASRYAPQLADVLGDAMVKSAGSRDRLEGSTVLIVDVSGSMDSALSGKTEMSRIDAAGCLAVVIRECCEDARIFTFSNSVVEVPNYRGLSLVACVNNSQSHGGTELRKALETVKRAAPSVGRVIVVTDEQSQDGIADAWTKHSYLINVAPYKHGLDTSQGWNRISGWSDRVVDWIQTEERTEHAE